MNISFKHLEMKERNIDLPHIRPNMNIKKATGERYSYVVAGAILSCSSGDKPNRLKMPFSHGVYIHNKAQMNIKDHIPNENIFPFGKCYSRQNPTVAAATAANNGILTPMPCTPMTTIPWIMGKDDKLIDGQPALLSKSELSCLYCGIIKIEDDGQLLEGAYARQVFKEIAEEVSARKSDILTASDAIPVECTPKYRAIITPPSHSTTPTKDAWQEAIEGSVAALTGIMDAVSEGGTYNMYQGEVPTDYPKSYLAGKLVGNAGVTGLGFLETLGGGALFVGGIAADSTGVGTIVGIPANVAGAAAMAHGSTVATQGAANFGRDAKDLYNHIVGGSSEGKGKTPVPTKPGGGSDPNNFVNEHAKKHMYDPSKPSTKNRSQYGQDVDVKELRRITMNNPDKAYSNWPNPNNPNPNRITKYYKEFDGNISTPDTPTGSHRVFENLDNPKSSSHFPYVPRNKD